MTREEAKEFLTNISYKLGNMSVEYLSEKDGEKMREAIETLEQEPQTFKWCTDCREYDQEKHCCHRWSKVIRDTVEEMKQEPKTSYLSIDDVMSVFDDFMCGEVDEDGTETFLEMLKDKAESEVEE